MLARQSNDRMRKAGTERPLRVLVLLVGLVTICSVHGPLIGYKTFANVDEAYAAALGERLLEGYKLYEGAVSQRGPLMYYFFELYAWLNGWDNILALRLWALGFALAHFFLTYWAARRLCSERVAIIAASLTAYGLAYGYPAEDAMAINGESLQLPALLVAVVLGAEALRYRLGSRERTWRLVLSGLLFGVAIMVKQSVAVHPAVVLFYIIVDARRRRASLKAFLRDAALLSAACALAPIVLLAHAAQQGTLGQLYYYCITYNRQIHLRPTSKFLEIATTFFFRFGEGTAFVICSVLLIGAAVPYVIRRWNAWRVSRSAWAVVRGFGVRQYLALHFVSALFTATAMYRFFPHYYLQASPFMAICVGIVLKPLFRRSVVAARAMVVAFMGCLLVGAGLGTYFGEKIDGRVSHDRTVQDLGRVIAATTSPDDKIFVWGFSPWIYEYSHRRPAGRYVFSTYVTGMVPWYWQKLDVERTRIVPGSMEALIGDLDREKPAIVIDAGSVMMARSMRLYEQSNAWLHEHYCFEMRLGALDLYRRKPANGECAVPFFPRAHETVDYQSRVMGAVGTPITLDYATSVRLPLGSHWKPIYFLRYPPPPGLEAARDKKMEKDEAEAEAEGFSVPEMEEIVPAKRPEPKDRLVP